MLTLLSFLTIFAVGRLVVVKFEASMTEYNKNLELVARDCGCEFRSLLVVCGMGGSVPMKRDDLSMSELHSLGRNSLRPMADHDGALARMVELGVPVETSRKILLDQARRAKGHRVMLFGFSILAVCLMSVSTLLER